MITGEVRQCLDAMLINVVRRTLLIVFSEYRSRVFHFLNPDSNIVVLYFVIRVSFQASYRLA